MATASATARMTDRSAGGRAALDLGGTLSGEHGIGSAKAPYLEWALGEGGLDLTRRIKAALDPQDILNPGKFTA